MTRAKWDGEGRQLAGPSRSLPVLFSPFSPRSAAHTRRFQYINLGKFSAPQHIWAGAATRCFMPMHLGFAEEASGNPATWADSTPGANVSCRREAGHY